MSGRGRLLLWILVAGTGLPAQAADDGVSFTIHHQYESPRALGMGDAFVAVANDYSALFYNPAGLARREDGELNLSIDAGLSPAMLKFSKDIQDAQKSGSTDSEKQQAILNVLDENYGKTFSARVAPASAVLVRPHWGIGFIPADVSMELTVHKQVGPAVNATVYGDSTLAYGYGKDVPWFDHARLSLGFTGKLVNRVYASKAVSAVELAADSNFVKKEDLHEGYTIDGDFGALLTPELPDEGIWSMIRLARPTFGVVVRNIAETGFAHSFKLINKDETEAPEKLYRVVDVGTRWEYPSAWIFGGRGVLDIRDIGHPDFNWRKGLHAGFEFDWTVASWWKGQYRVGISEGYYTAGLSALLGIFNLDFVTYAEDVGTYNHSKESRLYMVRLNLNF
jgi:hypothetical protein